MNSPRAFRTTELAKELSRQGHAVTVLTPSHPKHAAFAMKHKFVMKDLGLPKWRPVDLKGKGIALFLRRAIRRFSNLLFEYPSLELTFMVAKALRDEKGYDGLISIAVPYPIHWGVARIWNKNKKGNPAKVWIADCGDPYMGMINDTFSPPFYFGWVEKWFMRKADYITVPFAGALQAYYKEFHPKIRIIPQGFTFPDIQFNQPDNSVPTFAYAGNIGAYRYAAVPFLKLLNEINSDFKFLIYTKERAFYTKYLNQETIEKCYFNEYIPRLNLLYQLNKVDFLIYFPYAIGVQRSLKLIDYAYLGKPVLSFSNKDDDKNNFMDFLSGNYKCRLSQDVPDQYRIENVVNQFLELLEE